jgi:hypothetical protein
MALHICILGWKGIECTELLIENGAKLVAEDLDHHKLLGCAVVGNGRREMIDYLTAKSSPS